MVSPFWLAEEKVMEPLGAWRRTEPPEVMPEEGALASMRAREILPEAEVIEMLPAEAEEEFEKKPEEVVKSPAE